MSIKASLTDQQIAINRFAFLLLKHFNSSKIKVQDFCIKIPVEQLCSQDFDFLHNLKDSVGDLIALNVMRSGQGLVVLIGVAQIHEVPDFLAKYKRDGK